MSVSIAEMGVRTSFAGNPILRIKFNVEEGVFPEEQTYLENKWNGSEKPYFYKDGLLEGSRNNAAAQAVNCNFLKSLKTGVDNIRYENANQFAEVVDEVFMASKNMQFKIKYKPASSRYIGGKFYPFVDVLEVYDMKVQ